MNSRSRCVYKLFFSSNNEQMPVPKHVLGPPAMQFAVIAKFCDALEDGTISPKAISSAITPRTKATVVTHVWEMPCDMRAICEIIKRHPHILLFQLHVNFMLSGAIVRGAVACRPCGPDR